MNCARRIAKKRADGRASSLETIANPACQAAGPAQGFDIEWARQVVHEALDRMKRHCHTLGRHDLWEIFDFRVLKPNLEGNAAPSYAALMRQFSFETPTQASNAVITAKRMFVRSLRGVIAEYEPDEERIEAEIMDLRRIIGGTGECNWPVSVYCYLEQPQQVKLLATDPSPEQFIARLINLEAEDPLVWTPMISQRSWRISWRPASRRFDESRPGECCTP